MKLLLCPVSSCPTLFALELSSGAQRCPKRWAPTARGKLPEDISEFNTGGLHRRDAAQSNRRDLQPHACRHPRPELCPRCAVGEQPRRQKHWPGFASWTRNYHIPTTTQVAKVSSYCKYLRLIFTFGFSAGSVCFLAGKGSGKAGTAAARGTGALFCATAEDA